MTQSEARREAKRRNAGFTFTARCKSTGDAVVIRSDTFPGLLASVRAALNTGPDRNA